MRIALIYLFFTLAMLGVGVAAYALLQPNPQGDYLTGMAHLFISAMGAGAALVCAVFAGLLRFTTLNTGWVMAGAAVLVAAGYAALAFL